MLTKSLHIDRSTFLYEHPAGRQSTVPRGIMLDRCQEDMETKFRGAASTR